MLRYTVWGDKMTHPLQSRTSMRRGVNCAFLQLVQMNSNVHIYVYYMYI